METHLDRTTLVCLFHHTDQAQAALSDLVREGVPEDSISIIDNADAANSTSSLAALSVPERDQEHLLAGVRDGGVIVAVAALQDHVGIVEDIFGSHKAKKIDEAVSGDQEAPLALAATGETAIPIVEEELVVGKRTVDQGGVRVFRRIVEIPVEESVNLREEHVTVERHAVDRPVSDGDPTFGEDRVIELTETAEEAVIGKSARVVEEVLVGKTTSERTEQIHDTVRHTVVEVEEVEPATTRSSTF